MITKEEIQSAMESMLFIWGEPLDIKVMAEVFQIEWKTAYQYIKELKKEYEAKNGGILISEINKTFAFTTAKTNAKYIEMLCSPIKEKKLTQSALETLAIIAYKQPVTKGEIERIRGLKCTKVIDGLLHKNLIADMGRSTTIGRPILYGTTNLFLKHFGFETLSDLPDIEHIEELSSSQIVTRDELFEGEAEQLALPIE